MRISLLFLASLVLSVCTLPARAQMKDPKGIEFFEAKIRPVLVEHCYKCHSEDARKNRKLKGDLLLDSKAGMLSGGATGPALVAGKPGASLLMKALRHEGDLRMPRDGKLPPAIVADFEAWIKMGAPDPRDGKATAAVKEIDWNHARQFWAFQPPVKAPWPRIKGAAWPKRDIDHFILAELEKRQLKPVGPASKRDLLRRATFGLIGLPPTPEELDAFLKDDSPDAFAKVVDRLLASPHYGERWARYWLDISRYAEDKALAFVNSRPHAYRYRDWVVQALNRDMPYDRFVRLQIAGDLVNDPEPDPFIKLAGLGFQGLGAEYHRGSVTAQVIADELDDRIDTLTRGLLGLTVACARCHDHKYDPIPTSDYYSLAAAYNGSTLAEISAGNPKQNAALGAWQKEANERAWKITQMAKSASEMAFNKSPDYLLAAWKIRVLRQNKIPHDAANLARKEKLEPYFLNRLVNYLDSTDQKKITPLLRPWLIAANKAGADAKPLNTDIAVPEDLETATREGYERARRKAWLDRACNQLNAEQSAFFKTVLLDANAPFAVNAKDLPGLLDEIERKKLESLKKDVDDHKKTAPPPIPKIHGIQGGGTAMRVYKGGNVERLGEPAPPGYLRVLSDAAKPTEKFTRLELAELIASSKNPLTARVIVNRVWHYHFGRGIVGTPSNFGHLGDRPTHPELLDTLAVGFMENGWSLRWLHREIMLSRAYQLSSANAPANMEKDPENLYLWRHTPTRLDFEAWRDSWLAVSGRLDRKLGGPSLDLNKADNVRRTLYAKISRVEPNALMTLFDFPDSNVTSARRNVTTVPQQQLFVLNSEFTIQTAKAFANRLEKAAPGEAERIALAFRLAYGREPSDAEKRASAEFLREAGTPRQTDRLNAWAQFAQAILASNEFCWVD